MAAQALCPVFLTAWPISGAEDVYKRQVPNGVEGEVTSIHAGEFTVTDTVCTVKTAKGEKALTLMQRWPCLLYTSGQCGDCGAAGKCGGMNW